MPDKARPHAVLSPGFPARLLEHREAAGLTVRELADRAEINKETVSAWAQGGPQRRYTLEKVDRVAKALGTSSEKLLGLSLEPVASSASVPEPAHLSLVRRVAELQPLLDQIPELEDLVAEARRLGGTGE